LNFVQNAPPETFNPLGFRRYSVALCTGDFLENNNCGMIGKKTANPLTQVSNGLGYRNVFVKTRFNGLAGMTDVADQFRARANEAVNVSCFQCFHLRKSLDLNALEPVTSQLYVN
jgi:hypothetical protein